MPNKVLLAYVVSDGLFLLMGIFILAFSVVVQKIQFEIPTEGKQATRNLLYQRFPLQGLSNPPLYWLPFSFRVNV